MKRVGVLLVLAAVAVLVSDALAARRKDNDLCVNGIGTPSTAITTFAAGECEKRRQTLKRNHKVAVVGCSHLDQTVPAASLVPPFELPCLSSAHTEDKTGRFGVIRSAANWGSSFDLPHRIH